MRRSHRLHMLLAILSLFSLSLAHCSDQQDPDQARLEQVGIGTFSQAIDYSPFYIAEHFGWFKSIVELNNTKIRYTEFNDRAAISAAFASGELHVVFAAAPPIIISRAQGTSVRIVENSCTLRQEIVVRSGLPVHSVDDLRNKTIAVLRGTSSHYGLLQTLRQAELQIDEVDIRYMPPDQARTAFETDAIDGWAVWPPFVEQQEITGAGRVLLGGGAVIQSVMALDSTLIESRSEVAGALVRTIQRAKSWIRENPEDAQRIVSTRLQLPLEIVKLAWGKHDWSATLSSDVISDIGEKAAFLGERRLTRRQIAIDEIVDNRFVPRGG